MREASPASLRRNAIRLARLVEEAVPHLDRAPEQLVAEMRLMAGRIIRGAGQLTAGPQKPIGRPAKITQAEAIAAVQAAGGCKRTAAKALGVSRTTLYNVLPAAE